MNAPEPPQAAGESASSFGPPPVEGFWKTMWRNAGYILSWDIFCAAAVTAAGVVFVHGKTLDRVLPSLLAAEFGIIGALLGVVIAGLAIVAGCLSREYAVVLMRSKGGPAGDFWPFWYVAALAAASILSSAVALVVVEQAPCLQRAAFGVTTFLGSYALLAAVNLVGFVKSQGETRAYQLAKDWEREHAGTGT
jgi:hypothetical protein